MTDTAQTKSAFIAIVGRPNVGKSSLLNAIIGQKIAIVSQKPQTTRTRITGILTRGPLQLVFIDTPGLHKPKTALGNYMVKAAQESVADVDAAVFVTEATGELTEVEKELIASFKSKRLPAIAVINKTDLLKDKGAVLEKMALLSQQFPFDQIIPLSALTGEGVDILTRNLEDYAVEGPHFFEEDALTDQPEKVIAGEIIREKLLINMQEEIPHGTAVVVETMKERTDKEILDIDAYIFCERENHKGMIIGKGGQMLKKVATQAREDMERFFDIKINLRCWVKVKEDWRNREQIIRSMGYN